MSWDSGPAILPSREMTMSYALKLCVCSDAAGEHELIGLSGETQGYGVCLAGCGCTAFKPADEVLERDAKIVDTDAELTDEDAEDLDAELVDESDAEEEIAELDLDTVYPAAAHFLTLDPQQPGSGYVEVERKAHAGMVPGQRMKGAKHVRKPHSKVTDDASLAAIRLRQMDGMYRPADAVALAAMLQALLSKARNPQTQDTLGRPAVLTAEILQELGVTE
jgi:hypothetical protein